MSPFDALVVLVVRAPATLIQAAIDDLRQSAMGPLALPQWASSSIHRRKRSAYDVSVDASRRATQASSNMTDHSTLFNTELKECDSHCIHSKAVDADITGASAFT